MKLFTTSTCPQCQRLKDLFAKNRIAFEQHDLSTPEGLTELRSMHIFTMVAPVLVLDTVPPKHLESSQIAALSDTALLEEIQG